MKDTTFDEPAFFRAISASGARALLIGRRALVLLCLPVLTADYDFWLHIDDLERFNSAAADFDLAATHTPEEARRRVRYVLEILEDLPDVDAVVAALGGGGDLLAGIASVMRAKKPGVKIFAAEPETAAPLSVSLARNQASHFEGWKRSFVDGAGGKSVLPTIRPLLHDLVDGSIVMPLDDIAAMRKTADRVHVVAEGAGGCATAAALCGRAGTGKIVAVVSGGNIDLTRFARLVGAAPDR